MPADAKLGLLAGVTVVALIAFVYFKPQVRQKAVAGEPPRAEVQGAGRAVQLSPLLPANGPESSRR